MDDRDRAREVIARAFWGDLPDTGRWEDQSELYKTSCYIRADCALSALEGAGLRITTEPLESGFMRARRPGFPVVCQICGRDGGKYGLRKGRCNRCYMYWWRNGVERPTDRDHIPAGRR